MSAAPPEARKDKVLAHLSRLEIQLQVRDDAVYAAIHERAPQLRALRRGGRMFWSTLEGMPDQAKLGILALAGIVAYTIYSFVKGWFD